MALSAGVAYVEIRPLMTGFSGQLQRQLGPSVATAGASFDKVGGGLTSKIMGPLNKLGISGPLAFAALAAGAIHFGAAALKAFRESEQVAAQTTAAIESTGGAANVTADEVEDLAKAIRDYSGISDEAVQSAENMLLTFVNIRNEAGKGNDIFNQTTKAVADMATRMANGGTPSMEQMKAASIQLGKAMNDPIAGLASLARVGVKFTDEQKEQIKALVESNDLMGAQKIILGELTTEFGGSAEALGKANPFGIIKEQAGDLLEKLGELVAKLLKAIQPLVEVLVDALGPALDVVMTLLQPVIDVFSWLVDKLKPVLIPALYAMGIAWLAAMGPLGLVAATLIVIVKALQWIAEHMGEVVDAVVGKAIEKFDGLKEHIQDLAPSAFPTEPAGTEVPAFAHGGIMRRSGVALVGEEGPELAYLPGGTRVAPSVGAGMAIETHVHFHGVLTATPSEMRTVSRKIGTYLQQDLRRMGYAR